MDDQRNTLTDLYTQSALWEGYAKSGDKAWVRKDHREAIRFFTVALEKSKYFGSGDWRHAKSLQCLSRLYLELNNFVEAERLQAELLTLTERHIGTDSSEMIDELGRMAAIYEKAGRLAEAEATYKYMLVNHPLRLEGGNDPEISSIRLKCDELKQQRVSRANASETIWT